MNNKNEAFEPNRLLCIVSSMDRGGAETFLMKIYREIDKAKYQMDFAVTAPGAYDDEIRSMGGKIYHIPAKSKNPIKTFIELKKIVKDNGYKSVLRTSQQSLATLDLVAAKCGGAKKLIYRSSNAGMTEKGIHKVINKAFSFLPKCIPNVKLAPSTEAAEFVFGKKAVKNKKVTIMPNGLDYSLFEFDEIKREKIRKELGLENKHIVGHVGRFNQQKNHKFLIDIFNEIHKKDNNAHLLLIGKGELENEIRDKIERLELDKFVTIIAPVANINEYYMAMDVFVFPSFFEGMPNVIIEAQATGLPCVLSDAITKEANISERLTYISLKTDCMQWADCCIKKIESGREYSKEAFVRKRYDISKNIDFYQKKLFCINEVRK